jgi:Cu-Zn family superoxide dismutase
MPKRIRSRSAVLMGFTLVLAAAVLTAPLYGSGGSDSSSRNHVKVELVNASGAGAGFVKLTKQGGTVIVRGEVEGLTSGFHGFHVHAVGQCVAPFTSAGGHYNPGGVGHGSHAGDMPSLLVLDDGSAEAQFATDNFAIADLFDADGSAIIVHAAPDNFANIPTRYQSTTEGTFGPDSATLATGDAGGRVACGVVAAR